MSDDSESLHDRVVREGGAVVTVEVRSATGRWLGKRIVAASELRDARFPPDDVVRRHIESVGNHFHFEAKP